MGARFGRLAVGRLDRAHHAAPSGTTADPQIPDTRCCTSEIVRVVPIADLHVATRRAGPSASVDESKFRRTIEPA
jgi:hypothetical protein